MILHLCTLKGIYHFSVHWAIWSSSFSIISQSALPPILVSFADLDIENFNPLSRSFIEMMKSMGPSKDTCDTPLVTESHSEPCPFSKTHCFLSVSPVSYPRDQVSSYTCRLQLGKEMLMRYLIKGLLKI